MNLNKLLITSMSQNLSFTPIICANTTYGACYYKTLENAQLPDTSYKNVLAINLITLAGLFIYNNPKLDAAAKNFLNYFMSVCFYSESFIWGGGTDGMPQTYSSLSKNGILLCYYDQLLAWQRGWRFADSEDKNILQKTNTIPIFTSCVADCIIALLLRIIGHSTGNMQTKKTAIQYLGQQQQNFIAPHLFNSSWTYPINYGATEKSNPDVFKNKNDSTSHKFILGPSTWLAMSTDIITWLRKEDNKTATSTFKKEIQDGTAIWKHVKKYTYIYERVLIESFKKLNIKYGKPQNLLLTNTFGEFTSDIIKCFHWDIISSIDLHSNFDAGTIYNHFEIDKLIKKINNDSIFDNDSLQNMLKIFGETSKRHASSEETIHKIIDDITQTQTVTDTSIQAIQQFYCGKCCVCPFVDPATTCI